MAACRKISNLTQRNKLYLRNFQKYYSTSAEVRTELSKSDEIVIPYRIQRGPTDILKALASTISKDYTAAQYKYEDDPYFIPASNVAKRAFALSKESGRKAARYFLENYPELFKCNTSVPHIKAFHPPEVYTEENVSSDALLECVTNFDVKNSVLVYDLLKKKGITISQEIKHSLLELLCFYNEAEPPVEDYYEERYFSRDVGRDREKWKSKGMAETVFEDMEKDRKAYSALIAGAAKFGDLERVLALQEEMRNKNLTPTVEAYNNMIAALPAMQRIGESKWEQVQGLFIEMNKDGVKPDLYTMNAALQVLTKCGNWRKTKSRCLNLLAEMKRLNIEPSLGTYNLVLNIFCFDSDRDINVLYEIIKQIEGKEFTIRHPEDMGFFPNVMEVCWRFAQDKNLIYRINKILEFQSNCKLLGTAFNESRYFKNFFRILCKVEEIDKVMEVYEKYVPNTYTPEPAIMFDIISNIHLTGHYKYLPKICSDILLFEHTERENILSVALEGAGIMQHEKQVQEELVHIVWKIFEKLNMRLQGGRSMFSWTGQMLGNILNTFINGDDIEKSWSVLQQLSDQNQTIVGFPEKGTLLKFCNFCLQKQDFDKIKYCLRYAVNGAYPDFKGDFKKLSDSMFLEQKLDAIHKSSVEKILNAISVSDNSSDSESSDDSSSSDSSSSDEEDNAKK